MISNNKNKKATISQVFFLISHSFTKAHKFTKEKDEKIDIVVYIISSQVVLRIKIKKNAKCEFMHFGK